MYDEIISDLQLLETLLWILVGLNVLKIIALIATKSNDRESP
jgi:hypothetical protein